MTRHDRPGHPDAERLAAYVERRLTPALRAGIEAHLADCDECRVVVIDTAELLADERPIWRARITYAAAGLAAAAVLVLAVWTVRSEWTSGVFGGNYGPHVEALVAAFENEPTRPVEGRLSAGFRYAPAPSITRGGTGAEWSPDVQIAVAEVERAVASDVSMNAQWALGTARLVARDFDGSIAALEAASRDARATSRLQSDLAAAYLTRAASTSSPEDARRALDAADRALALEPALEEALFNRALALDALADARARQAWQTFLAHNGDQDWEQEASERSSR